MSAKVHELKCWPEFFTATWAGDKRFEIRKNDRDYHVGDILKLAEWSPKTGFYSGSRLTVRVTYMMQGTFGLPKDVCVMSIESCDYPGGGARP